MTREKSAIWLAAPSKKFKYQQKLWLYWRLGIDRQKFNKYGELELFAFDCGVDLGNGIVLLIVNIYFFFCNFSDV